MKRNQNSRFALAPLISHPRSRFDRSHSLKSSGKFGDIIPIRVAEVYPGDTVKVKASALLRLVTPINPTMDDAYCDTYFFYVPSRLVWTNFTGFLAGKSSSASYGFHTGQVTEYEVDAKGDLILPFISSLTADDTVPQSIFDYFGIPVGYEYDSNQKDQDDFAINALPFLCYNLIYNEWFRSELSPLKFCCLTTILSRTNVTKTYFSILKACRFMDYFSVLTPSPQKGASVAIPIGESAPVRGTSPYAPVGILDETGEEVSFEAGILKHVTTGGSDPTWTTEQYGNDDKNWHIYHYGTTNPTSHINTMPNDVALQKVANIGAIQPYADLTQAAGVSVLQLRLLVQTQKLLERLSLGSRYEEIIYNFFGVRPGDYRVQRPEYLGGYRTHINMTSIAQTAQDNSDTPTPLGTLAGHSATAVKGGTFVKSFTEYGYIIGVMVCRVHHTYSQGLNRLWKRRNRLDLYNPLFQNVGNIPVYLYEIYAKGKNEAEKGDDNSVFGYGEYAGDLRFEPSRISGYMRPEIDEGLPTWTYADKYDSKPFLGTDWLEEDGANVERTLALQSPAVNFHFIFDMYFNEKWTRPMPVYSMPGLIDHH